MRRTLLARIATGAGVALTQIGDRGGCRFCGEEPRPRRGVLPQHDLTDAGDEIVVNQGFASPGLRVGGAKTVIVPREGNTGGRTAVHVHGGGPALDEIEPFEPPLFTIPVLIAPPGA